MSLRKIYVRLQCGVKLRTIMLLLGIEGNLVFAQCPPPWLCGVSQDQATLVVGTSSPPAQFNHLLDPNFQTPPSTPGIALVSGNPSDSLTTDTFQGISFISWASGGTTTMR